MPLGGEDDKLIGGRDTSREERTYLNSLGPGLGPFRECGYVPKK